MQILRKARVVMKRCLHPHYYLAGLKIRGLMSDEELFGLAALVRTLPAESVVLEIGVYLGKSSFFIEKAIGGKAIRHVIVDTFETGVQGEVGSQRRSRFEENMTKYISRLDVWKMNSLDLETRLCKEGIQVDMAFIDGDHSYAGVRNDIDAVLAHSKPNALLCLHDFMNKCGVMRAVGESVERGEITPLRIVGSMLVARKKVDS